MRLISLILIVMTIQSCEGAKPLSGKNKAGDESVTLEFTTGPSVLVYKTKKNYNDRVPVLLSADKKEIISYPAPSDLISGSDYPKPVQLAGGYLLDQRGIGINVAFLRLTYEEYASLEKAPSKDELRSMIIDTDPLVELCNCGSKNAFNNIAAQLDELIESGQLRNKCKVIK